MNRFNWLGDAGMAMTSIISVNVCGRPLLRHQPPGRSADDASGPVGCRLHQWGQGAPPLLVQPVILLVTLFSFIWTIADFQLVFVVTPGQYDPCSRHLAHRVSMSAKLGEGAAMSLFLLSFLLLRIGAVLWVSAVSPAVV